MKENGFLTLPEYEDKYPQAKELNKHYQRVGELWLKNEGLSKTKIIKDKNIDKQ